MSDRPFHLLDRIVVLRPGEARTAWLMFAYSFLVMTAYNIIKPITRAKAISALGAENLPYALVAAALVIGVLMHGYGWGTRRLPRHLIAPATQAGLSACLVGFWVLFRTDAAWVSGAFFVFGLIFGLLLVSQFWTLANELYDSRQAGRLFGFIGGGASLGGVTGAAVTTYTVGLVGSDNLALVSAGVLILCAATVLAIVGHHPVAQYDQSAGDEANTGNAGLDLMRRSRHLRLIALIVGTAALGAVFVEQQLNMAVAENVSTTDEITRFLGQVTMYLSMAGFAAQVGLTSRLHRKFGLATALLLLPIVLGASSIVILATGAVWASAMARVLDTSLRYTVDRTTREVLFLPLPADLTQRAKPFIDVTVDRIVKGGGAILLLVLIKPWGLDLTWQQLSYVNLGIVAIWITLGLAAHREYLETFRRNLHRRAMEPSAVRFDVADDRTIALLVNELDTPDEASVLYAIDMLETAGHSEQLPHTLLTHESGKVRARALRALELSHTTDSESQLPAIRHLMTDPDADVRAAAVRTVAALHDDERRTLVRPHLEDPSPRVAATAAAELADSGQPDDEAAAEAALARMIGNSAEPVGRQQAAAALSQIRNPAFKPLLVPLIYDADVSVSREAIKAAGAQGAVDALLVPALVSRLGHRLLKASAREALVGSGATVVELLAHVMADPHEHVWVRRHVPATLQAIPDRASVTALAAALSDPDGFLRFKSLVALERLHRAHSELRPPETSIETHLLKETSHYCELLTLRHNLIERDPECAGTLLLSALDDKLRRCLDRVFHCVGLLYSWTDVAAARYALQHGDSRQRAGALEYLDQVMTGAVRKQVMPIIDDGPMSDRVRHANRVTRTGPRDIPDTLVQLFHHRDPILASTAVHYAGERGWRTALSDDLDFLTARTDTPPLVLQAARWVQHASLDMPAPYVELVNQLRVIPVFVLVSVNELFRIVARATRTQHAPGVEIYRRGERADQVMFLLTGSVRTEAVNAPAAVVAAPAALNLGDALVGQPLAQTAIVVEDAVGLVLTTRALLTVLADDSSAAQGLFRTLLGSYGALDQTTGVHGQADAVAVELGLRLRQIPLFRSATAAHLKALVAATHEVRLTAGTVLWDETHAPAIHYLLAGEVRVEGPGRPTVVAGAGRTIGAVETLTGTSLQRRAVVSQSGRALRLAGQDLFDVMADHTDLLQSVFANVLDSGRTATPQ